MPEQLLITKDDINQAIDMVEPAILANMTSGRFHRKIIAIEVQIENHPELMVTRWVKFDESLPIEDRFADIAHGKTELALRTRQSTGVIVNEFPHLLVLTDPIYRGGVYEVGIAVGASAFKAFWDHMIALWILDAIVAIGRAKFAMLTETGKDFVGDCIGVLEAQPAG